MVILASLACEIHFFHQVEIVVAAGGAVGAQPHSHARRAQVGDGRNAAGQHHVAGWVVDAAHLLSRQGLFIGRVHEDAMRGNHIRAEQSDLVQILHRRHSVLLLAVFPLFFHFGSMNQDGGVVFPGQGGGVLQCLPRAGVDRVRRYRGVNQRIALPLLEEFICIGQHFSFALVVGRGKIDESFAQYPAHAGGFGFFRHGIFEVIHVGEGCDAPANLLGGGEARAPAHKLLIHVLRFRWENVLIEPVVEGHVIMQAPKQGHGTVSMAVDESGQDQRALGIDRLGSVVPGFEFAARADGDDGVTFDDYGSVVEDGAGAVHGDDCAAADEQVGFYFLCLRREERGK